MIHSLTARALFACALAAIALITGSCFAQADPAAKVEPADLVLRHGKIVTVDANFGTVQAVAARGGRIAAVGADEAIAKYIGPQTKVIELDGALAIPGFIEGHGHFTGLGESKMNLDLMHVKNWDEVIAMVADAVKKTKSGEWIVGRGWHQEKWDAPPRGAVEGFPTHQDLSAVSPENPVLLTHASGHASFANQKAMELAGISGTTPDPAGGEILRDEAGAPIGIFRETASGLLSRAMSSSGGEASGGAGTERRDRFARLDRAIALAAQECLRKGVTSFQDAGSSFFEIETFARKAESGDLPVRLWVMIREPNERIRQELGGVGSAKHHRAGNAFLTVGGIKRTIDGALGSRGAWLLEPYSDSPDSTGLATATIEDVTETAQIALENGLQLCVHAIGDRANREVLDIYEKAFQSNPDKKPPDLRWRIEHAQHLNAADIPRFGQLGVIASMQGVHCTSDAPWVIARLGRERAEEGAYVWQKLLKSGAIVTNGTDAPVEDVDPIASYYASVSRRLQDGTVFFPDQRMSRMEALRSYTIDCAYAAFEDDIKGSLTPGKLADIVVLSQDILTVPEDKIRDAKVRYTIVGGKVAYSAE